MKRRRVRAVIEDEEEEEEEENAKNGAHRVIHSSSTETDEESDGEASSDSSPSQPRTPMKATTNIQRMVRYQNRYYQSDEEDLIGNDFSGDEEDEANFVVPDNEMEEEEEESNARNASDSDDSRESREGQESATSDGEEDEGQRIGRRKKKRKTTRGNRRRNGETTSAAEGQQSVRVSERIQRKRAEMEKAMERKRERRERKRRMDSSDSVVEVDDESDASAGPSTSDDHLSDFIVDDEDDQQQGTATIAASGSGAASSSATTSSNNNASSRKGRRPTKKQTPRVDESPGRRLRRLPIREITSNERLLQLIGDDQRWTFPDELVLRVARIDHCSAVDQGYPSFVQCQFFKILLGNDAGSTIELHAWWNQQTRIEDELEIGKVYIFYCFQVFAVAPCRAQFNEGTVPIVLNFNDDTEIEECRINPILEK